MKRTVVCKLIVPEDSIPSVRATMEAFARACNFVADTGRSKKVSNQYALHPLCYREIRTRFGLMANSATRAIARVAPILADAGARSAMFNATSMDYDRKTFRLDVKSWMVSLAFNDGRRRFALSVGDYQRKMLAGQTPTSAVLFIRRGKFYIGIRTKEETPDPVKRKKFIGVDLGQTDIATLSTGKAFSGTKLTNHRLKRARVRRSLQSKAANGDRTTRRNCRRLLRRLKGRETRFQTWVNHNISREVVDLAKESECGIALENLKGIRDRTNKKTPRKRRGLSNSWSFYQLRQFVEYKAELVGVPVAVVDPAYTSQTCHCCGSRGTRTKKVFVCTSCGTFDADINAAKNIAQLGCSVSAA